jgi:hypothetical protein
MSQDVNTSKREIFLGHLSDTGRISEAAQLAGLDRSRLYKLRKEDPEFSAQWLAAEADYVERLEAAAHERAIDGWEEKVFHQGVECGTQRKYSDSLLTLLLKGRLPTRYRENATVKIGNDGDTPFKVEESPTAAARKIAFALALGLRAAQSSENSTGDDPVPLAGHSDGADLV